ncbi:MAG: hypothetical protein ACK5KR_04960 [Breznakia sp.]
MMMKKTIMLLSASTLTFGISFNAAMNKSQQTQAQQPFAHYEYVNVSYEYDKEENIKKNLAIMLDEKHHQKAISFTRIDAFGQAEFKSDMSYQYKIGTVYEDELKNNVHQLPDKEYIVTVQLKDTKLPTISGVNVTLKKDAKFDVKTMKISATDEVDGALQTEIDASKVDTSKAGTYNVSATAKDFSGNKVTKTFQAIVVDPVVTQQQTNTITATYANNYTNTQNPTIPAYAALDRNNLNVRGWKVIVNDARISDDTIRAYMNNLQNLPGQYSTAHFQTVYIEVIPQGYLGLAYSNGIMKLNGLKYRPTTVLHEATHMYDFKNRFSRDANLIAIRNAELNNLPVKYSGNMKSNPQEWVANIVVYFFNDPYTLRTLAPRSYDYVANIIF